LTFRAVKKGIPSDNSSNIAFDVGSVWENFSYLLRLAHMYEVDTPFQDFANPVEVDINRAFFPKDEYHLQNIRQTLLGANANISTNDLDPRAFRVSLSPIEIKTYEFVAYSTSEDDGISPLVIVGIVVACITIVFVLAIFIYVMFSIMRGIRRSQYERINVVAGQ